jgi:hypothetical protein
MSTMPSEEMMELLKELVLLKELESERRGIRAVD